MKKLLVILCLSVCVCMGGFVRHVNAYSGLADAVFFYEGIDLDLGEVYQDKSVLIIIYGPDPLEEALAPSVIFDDFAPQADIYFEFTKLGDPVSLVFILEDNNQPDITGVAKLTGPGTLSELSFDDTFPSVLVNEKDIVVLRMTESEYITLNVISIDVEEFKVTLEITHNIIPEPSTLLLLGLGLLGFTGLRWWRKKGKRFTAFFLLITIIGTSGVVLLGGARPVTAQNITASVEDGGGSISPEGTVSGANQEFTIEANAGYRILEVLIDGKSIGPVNTYMFTDGEDHTITATFIQDSFQLAIIMKKCVVQGTTEKIACDAGTVMAGNDRVCGVGCTMLVAPFSKSQALILKAEGSTFERWEELQDDEIISQDGGIIYRTQDINLDAIFLFQLPGGPSNS